MSLALTRRVDEAIIIGDDIRVVVIRISGDQARLAIDAPDDTTIHREEVYERIKQGIPFHGRKPDPQ